MLKDLSLRKKILVSIGGTITALMLVASFFLIEHIAGMSRQSIEQEAKNYITNEKLQVESFFAQYGRVSNGIVNNPHLINWFKKRSDRNVDHTTIEGYAEVAKDFERITADPNILSTFFASAQTGEYFKESEVTANYGDGRPYFSYKRPWWKEALDKGGLFVGDLSVDINSGAVSSVVQQPVYSDGVLIGVGGVDLQLNRIADMVEDINFRGQGHGFLLDGQLNVVHLSKKTGHSLSIVDDDDKKKDSLRGLERDFNETSGFAELNSMMQDTNQGFTEVTLKGENYYVAFNRIEIKSLQLSWTIGLLLPAEILDTPVQNAVWTTFFSVIAMLVMIAVVIIGATSAIAKPLLQLTDVMQGIASGEGDLTRQIDIKSNDEVGQLAVHVNTFTAKLRDILRTASTRASQVGERSLNVNQISTDTDNEIQQERQQIDGVSVAVTEMAATVQEISRNAQEANDAAETVQELTQKGTELSKETQVAIDSLSEYMGEASTMVSGLEKESTDIGSVVDVINSIAEQTNLLALNAAIESARAGEQGRGFAVVADEVRSLASRTQESTDDIRNMITKLQHNAQSASSVMEKGQARTEETVSKTKQVLESFNSINQSVDIVQGQSYQIATATEEQTTVAEGVNQSLHSINKLINRTSENTGNLVKEAEQLTELSQQLNSTMNQFKL